MQPVKETSANIAASAKAGLDKTKAVLEEKVEKMTARDPVEKEMAARKKEEKIKEAELRKQVAKSQNAAASAGGGGVGYTATGAQEMPTMPNHGVGHPSGQVTEGVVVGSQNPEDVMGSQHPATAETGTGGRTTSTGF